MACKKIYQAFIFSLLAALFLPLVAAQDNPDEFLDQYQIAREKYQEALDGYRNAHGAYISEKNKMGANNSENQKRHEAASNFILKGNELMINRLEYIIARIESTEGISREEKQELKFRIYGQIDFLYGKNIEIGRGEGAGDPGESAGDNGDIKEKWTEINLDLKKINGLLLVSKVDGIISRGMVISEKLHVIIGRLDKKETDTAYLEELKAEYDQKISQARESNLLALEKFNSIEGPDSQKSFQEGIALVIEARNILGDARNDLKLIRVEIARLSGKENPYGNAAL